MTAIAYPASNQVFVIDDTKEGTDNLFFKLEDLQYQPAFPPDDDVYDLDSASKFLVSQRPAAVICDHRLKDNGFANYDGAELVARLIASKIPAILVTQFLDIDVHTSIRRYRYAIPVVLARDDATKSALAHALDICKKEIEGTVELSRRPHKVLLEVVGRERASKPEESGIDVFIDSWKPMRAVRFPLTLIPKDLHEKIDVGSFLYAEVNIGSEDAKELYIKNIELSESLDIGEDDDW